jgi:hypothetical protein
VSRPFQRDDAGLYVGCEKGTPEWHRAHRYARIATANRRLARKLTALRKQLALARDPNVDTVTLGHVRTKTTTGLVRKLAAVGVPPGRIAMSMGLSLADFTAHYGTDVTEAKLAADAKVLATMHRVATSVAHPGVVPAAKKWLEVNVDGWKDVRRIETADVTEGPPIIDSSKLDPEERAELRRLLMKTQEATPHPDTVVASQYTARAGLAGGYDDDE